MHYNYHRYTLKIQTTSDSYTSLDNNVQGQNKQVIQDLHN